LVEADKARVADEVISFLVRVNRETGKVGDIAIGNNVIEVTKVGNDLVIGIPGQAPLTIDSTHYKEDPDKSNATHQALNVSISMSDLKMILDKSYDQTKNIQIDEALDGKPATVEIDLNHFKLQGLGLREAILPVLIEEIRSVHKQAYGANAKYLIKGSDATLVEQVIARLNEGTGNDLIAFSSESKLTGGYAELKNRIILATPQAQGLSAGIKRFYMKTPEQGDIPNFRAALKLSLAIARLDEVNVGSLNTSRISDLLHAFIPTENLATFVKVVIAEITDEEEIKIFALPAIIKLPIESWIQGARMAAKLILQSA
jgi:hypothetical protein